MWDHLALLGPRRRSAHPRLERVCSLSVCQLFRLSRFVPDFNVSGKTAEPKMAFNFAHLLSAACGGAPRRLGRLRRPWARCARLFWGGYQHRKSAGFGYPFGVGSEPTLLELPASVRSRHGRACEAPVPPVKPMLSPLPPSRLARHLASPQGSSLAPAASLCRSPAPAPPPRCPAPRDAPPSPAPCIRATPAVPLLARGSHVTANAPAAAP